MPLSILGKALDHMGDFPFKHPGEVRFEKPALFIRGTQGRYVPDDVLPLVGQFFPRFELVDVDSGHWVISEQPEAFRQGQYSSLLPSVSFVADHVCRPVQLLFGSWVPESRVI